MISRHWKGVARPGQAGNYSLHLREHTFPALQNMSGFVRASILRREIHAGTEFLIITTWQSLDAIRAFADDDVEATVVPSEVQSMVVNFDRRAVQFEIVE